MWKRERERLILKTRDALHIKLINVLYRDEKRKTKKEGGIGLKKRMGRARWTRVMSPDCENR